MYSSHPSLCSLPISLHYKDTLNMGMLNYGWGSFHETGGKAAVSKFEIWSFFLFPITFDAFEHVKLNLSKLPNFCRLPKINFLHTCIWNLFPKLILPKIVFSITKTMKKELLVRKNFYDQNLHLSSWHDSKGVFKIYIYIYI